MRLHRFSLTTFLTLAICGMWQAMPVAVQSAPNRSKLDAPEDDAASPRSSDDSSSREPPTEPPAKGVPAAADEGSTDDHSQAPSDGKARATDKTRHAVDNLRVCDWIYIRRKNEIIRLRIQLHPTTVEPWPATEVRRFTDFRSGETSKVVSEIKGAEFVQIAYYEHRVLQAAAKRLEITDQQMREPGHPINLSTATRRASADQALEILRTGIKEHDSAVQRRLRTDLGLRRRLRLPLLIGAFNLELALVDLGIRQEKLVDAAARCDQLRKQFKAADPAGDMVNARYEKIFLAQAKRALDAGKFSEARGWMGQLDDRLAGAANQRLIEFRRDMSNRAAEQLKLAAAARNRGDRDAVGQYLDRAKEIWPELLQIESQKQKWDQEYPILHCAFTYLPRNLAPFGVLTPVERHAVSLIFESLVQWTSTQADGGHYRMCLAEDQPLPLALGRHFRLRRCEWWDPEESADARFPFSAEDVIKTAELQRNNPWTRANFAALKEVNHHGDPFQIDLKLKDDHWQPLAFMDFWIVPNHRFQAENAAEAWQRLSEHPVGTGPYYLAERREDSVRFRASPRYRHPGKPLIKEIHFDQMEPDQGHEQFVAGRVQLLYGVRKAHRDQLHQSGRQACLVPLNSPSVYFLAPNYASETSPLKDDNFRLAIAHAINREEILDQYFRDNAQDPAFQSLTGPFPKESWAYNRNLQSVRPYAVSNAKTYLAEARKKLGDISPLTLIYPNDDPDTENACRRIQENLQAVGIEMTIEPVAITGWHARVLSGGFQLAYWRHDFPNETYSLEPLFDLTAKKNGTNFMSYDQDEDLTNLLAELRQYKQFARVRELTHQLHQHIAESAIVIPLWQLDTYVAISERLGNRTLDSRALFGNIQDWSLAPQRLGQ